MLFILDKFNSHFETVSFIAQATLFTADAFYKGC